MSPITAVLRMMRPNRKEAEENSGYLSELTG